MLFRSYYATRVLNPTKEDQRKLDRILHYLRNTENQKYILKIGANTQLRAYVDSSFGLYKDGKLVTGIVIMLGDAPVYVMSGRQKIITR